MIRSPADAVTGVNVQDAIGANANTVPFWLTVDVETAVDASVQIVVNVQLVFINLKTADTVALLRVPVVQEKNVLFTYLNAGQYCIFAHTIAPALSFSADATRIVSEKVYVHDDTDDAVKFHHSVNSVWLPTSARLA